MIAAEIEDLLRRLTPQVLGAVVRRYGNFDLAEDATQEALLAAAGSGRKKGCPDNPKGWLVAVASRRLTDLLRAEQARRRREDTVAGWALAERGASGADERGPGRHGRHARVAVHVLSPVAFGRVADRPDAAGGRGTEHRRDRARPARVPSRR